MAQYQLSSTSKKSTLQNLSDTAKNPTLISDIPNPYDLQISTISIPSAYYTLNKVTIISKGLRYPATVQAILPSPSKNDGIQATCSVGLGLTPESISLSGGTNHTINDRYLISQNNNYIIIQITEINNEGSPTKYDIYDQSGSFTNDEFTDITPVLNNLDAVPADITLIPDKFCIQYIELENKGSGYQGYDNDNASIQYDINLINAGEGKYFSGYCTCDSYSTLEFISNISISELTNGDSLSINNKRKLFSEKIHHYPQTLTHPADSVQSQTQTYHFDSLNQKWIQSYSTLSESSSSSSCDSSRQTIVAGLYGLYLNGISLREYMLERSTNNMYFSLWNYADKDGIVQLNDSYFQWSQEWDDLQQHAEDMMSYMFAKEFEISRINKKLKRLESVPPLPPYDGLSDADIYDLLQREYRKKEILTNKLKQAKKSYTRSILRAKNKLTPTKLLMSLDRTCYKRSYDIIMQLTVEQMKTKYKPIMKKIAEVRPDLRPHLITAHSRSTIWLEDIHQQASILFDELDKIKVPKPPPVPPPLNCSDFARISEDANKRKTIKISRTKAILRKLCRYAPLVEIPVALYVLYEINSNTAYGAAEKAEKSTWTVVCAANPVPVPGMSGDFNDDVAFWVWANDNLHDRMMKVTRIYLEKLSRNEPGAEEWYKVQLEGCLEQFKIQGYFEAGYDFDVMIQDIIVGIQASIDLETYRQSLQSISLLDSIIETEFSTIVSGAGTEELFDPCQSQLETMFNSNCEDSCDNSWQDDQTISCLNNSSNTFRPFVITISGPTP